MNEFVRDRLEEHLSGALDSRQQALLEAYLEEHPAEAEELALYEQSAGLLRDLRPPEGEVWEPDPGFYARVVQRVEGERRVPFWMVFLEPAFARRLAFASLMWLALLGGYLVTFSGPTANQTPHVAETMLTEPPSPEYNLRLGTDLERNRDSMLAVMMTGK